MKTTKQNRIGDWFLTYTGKQFWPLDPRPDDICIEDIAHALSNICRFGGHVKNFYSVAQHSLLVHKICPTFQALMHDATEAYIGDMVRPLKVSQPDFKSAERLIWINICERFGINPIMQPEVKDADNIALFTERRDLMFPGGPKWKLEEQYKPVKEKIITYVPYWMEKRFLQEFNRYQIRK